MSDQARYLLPTGQIHPYDSHKSAGEAIAQLRSLGVFQWSDHVRATPGADGVVTLTVINATERRDW